MTMIIISHINLSIIGTFHNIDNEIILVSKKLQIKII